MRTQHLTYGVVNTVEIYVPTRPATTQTVRLVTGDGSVIFAATSADLSTISTTISAAAARGDETITVASATGITAGARFWLRTPSEEVRCKSISSTTVTLWAPLTAAHASGSVAQGTRISESVTAALSSTLFWDGRLEWVVDTNTYYHQHCICTKYPFYRIATGYSLVREEPKIEQLIDDETDLEQLLDDALDEVVLIVAGRSQGRAWTYTGPDQFEMPNVFAALWRLYRQRPGEAAKEMAERNKDLMMEKLDQVMSSTPRDADQDGVISAHEKLTLGSVQIFRS